MAWGRRNYGRRYYRGGRRWRKPYKRRRPYVRKGVRRRLDYGMGTNMRGGGTGGRMQPVMQRTIKTELTATYKGTGRWILPVGDCKEVQVFSWDWFLSWYGSKACTGPNWGQYRWVKINHMYITLTPPDVCAVTTCFLNGVHEKSKGTKYSPMEMLNMKSGRLLFPIGTPANNASHTFNNQIAKGVTYRWSPTEVELCGWIERQNGGYVWTLPWFMVGAAGYDLANDDYLAAASSFATGTTGCSLLVKMWVNLSFGEYVYPTPYQKELELLGLKKEVKTEPDDDVVWCDSDGIVTDKFLFECKKDPDVPIDLCDEIIDLTLSDSE